MTSNNRGFTLVELIVVIAMIAIFMAAVGTAIGKTRERARIEKARSDVKVVSQAILAWENYSRGGKHELREMNDEEADSSTLAFLLGQGESAVTVTAEACRLPEWGMKGEDCAPTPVEPRLKAQNMTLVTLHDRPLKTVLGEYNYVIECSGGSYESYKKLMKELSERRKYG